MTIDRSKLACWLLVIAAVAAGIVFKHEHKPVPPPLPSPVVVVQPPPPPPPPPAPVAPVPPVAPKAAIPSPPVHVKPLPPKKRPKAATVERKDTKRCAIVPAAAYTHAQGTVIKFAEWQGVSADALATLKWCIGAR